MSSLGQGCDLTRDDLCKADAVRYPYITSVYANAGLMAVRYVAWHRVFTEIFRVGPFRTFAYPDRYQVEQQGRMSRDGERGSVWSVNTLAPYILVCRPFVYPNTLLPPACLGYG